MAGVGKLVIVIVISAVTAVLSVLPPSEKIDLAAGDQLRRLAGKTAPPANVIVVALDEASYQEFQVGFDQLWPRDLHAKLLGKLKGLGVSRVAFDVLFTSRGPDPAVDQQLAHAFSLTETVLGAEPTVNQSALYERHPVSKLELPIPEFANVSTPALVGLDLIANDGIIRAFPVLHPASTDGYLPLAYAAAGVQHHPEWRLPGPRDLIKYYGSARENARIFSYWEIFQELAPQEAALFKDSIVFIGLLLRSDTGPAQKDSYLSPFGSKMIFGVEVHAAIAGNLLQQSWIHRPARRIEVTVQSLLAGVIGFVALTVTPIVLFYIVAITIGSWILIGTLMMKSGVFLAGAATALIVLPSMVLVSAVTSYLAARRSADEARQREEAIRAAFSLYVSPDVLPKLQSNELQLSLGGESLVLTAMFTDIADFTSISESMPAEQTSQMLNAYFTEVMDVVFANQGTLLKFIGDAIFAVWGAPVELKNHAELALRTALAIQQGVERFNASQRFPPLITRVGVHTGQMLVGNLGSSKRFDYTAIGDSVNLASRLEGLNKYLGTTLLFSDATRHAAGELHGAIPIARVVVKGRSESVQLFSLFEPALSESVAAAWSQALEDFCAGRFESARLHFEAIPAVEHRLAVITALYLDRIKEYVQFPPGGTWNGELTFTVK